MQSLATAWTIRFGYFHWIFQRFMTWISVRNFRILVINLVHFKTRLYLRFQNNDLKESKKLFKIHKRHKLCFIQLDYFGTQFHHLKLKSGWIIVHDISILGMSYGQLPKISPTEIESRIDSPSPQELIHKP